MELDDDDWGLSAEEFDSLERDALLKIASQQQQQQQQQQPSASSSFNQQQNQQLHFSNKPIFNSPSKKVKSSPFFSFLHKFYTFLPFLTLLLTSISTTHFLVSPLIQIFLEF
jgi:hypothetical protein